MSNTNYYIRSINQDGTGELVIPEFDKPHKGENAIIHDVWNNHLSSLPPVGIASKELTKSNGVGFVKECNVTYQGYTGVLGEWGKWEDITVDEYREADGNRRLYLTSKQNKEAVICLNCKSVYAKGIEVCPVCDGKTFQSTDPSNLTRKVSVPTQDQLPEEVRRLREALEGLLDAIPKETLDADWWDDSLKNAVNAARTALQQTSKTENNG